LNYFIEFLKNKSFINPHQKKYKKKYEIEFSLTYGQNYHKKELSLLDFLVLDRIRFFSTNSFGFEKRAKTLEDLKTDYINELIYQRFLINELKTTTLEFYNNEELKINFLRFLDNNQMYSIFFLKNILSDDLTFLNLIKKFHKSNPNIKNLMQFHDYQNRRGVSFLIDENLFFKKENLKDFLPVYYNSKIEFEKILNEIITFKRFIEICHNLKIYDLNLIRRIIGNRKVRDIIYKKEESKLKEMSEVIKLSDVTIKVVENKIKDFLEKEPFIIKPLLINTIPKGRLANFYPILVLKNTIKTKKIINSIKTYFPHLTIYESIDFFSHDEILYIEFYIPDLNASEKHRFFSILYNRLEENIVLAKEYFHRYIPVFSLKSFYEQEHNQFYYSKYLFNQYFLYTKKILGEPLKPPYDRPYKIHKKFWSREKDILNLIKKVNDRVMRENVDFNIDHLKKLLNFHLNLDRNILDIEKFKVLKKEFYFKNYIKAIKFIPAFRFFGLGQYFLYVFPSDLYKIDFNLLLLNTFQKICYPASIDNSIPLFIKYIKPYDVPNLKYLHWLTKSKKTIREYCGFFIQKVYHILHFDYNINKEGWIYESGNFKMHMQNILFNPSDSVKIPKIKEYKINERSISSNIGPDFPEIDSLSQIYDWDSIDIKTYLGTKKLSIVNQIQSLLKENLIFPYLSLKNLDFQESIYIIAPNLNKELISTLVKIFSFFNLAFIYEIKGEYFIHGFDQEVKFQNGLMIKLYFPKCEISEFLGVFDLLFEYLEINDYIILNDLVEGKNLLKSIYGGLDFLKSYNPLKNLEWNKQEKRWMNPKVFTSKFEPIYPDLIPKDKP
jgi:hypothetical protein